MTGLASSTDERRAARQARAEAAGFTSYGAFEYAQRKAKAERLGYTGGYREARAARTEARTTGDTAKLRGGDRPGGTPRRQVFTTPAGVVIRTRPGMGGMDVLQRRIDRAPRGTRAKVLVTMSDGRTLTLYGKGGISTAALRARIDDAGGDLGDAIESDLGDVYGDAYAGGAVASVQVVIA